VRKQNRSIRRALQPASCIQNTNMRGHQPTETPAAYLCDKTLSD
jgi:hypothetical protein